MSNNPERYTPETLVKKVRCTQCRSKLKDGTIVIHHYDERNKLKAYICSEKCLTSYNGRKENPE